MEKKTQQGSGKMTELMTYVMFGAGMAQMGMAIGWVVCKIVTMFAKVVR